MKLEDQVCSLELAKKLKELGLKDKHLFVWTKDYEDSPWYVTSNPLDSSLQNGWYYQAYTVAELGEMLPLYAKIPSSFYQVDGEDWELHIDNANSVWNIEYKIGGYGYDFVPVVQSESDKNFSNAIAKMVIYLKENGLLTF